MVRRPREDQYDFLIIGAGMAGMAAAIRLGHFGKKVLLLERHAIIGGLNSFYKQDGRKYDVGLHAVTNYVPAGTKRAPLTKLLRQLRISHADLGLSPQNVSRVAFPGHDLRFSNDFALLESEVARVFPKEIDRFRSLTEKVKSFDELDLQGPKLSARKILSEELHDPLLIDMLLCPLMYYGSAKEGDMDFYQFVIMFKALFLEGFARPFEGVRHITQLLLRRMRELPVERIMNCGVQSLRAEEGEIKEVLLENGRVVRADCILSTIGSVETAALVENDVPFLRQNDEETPRLSFVETISVFDQQPVDWGWDETIVFFNDQEEFAYEQPDNLVDPRSGVICFPNNYQYPDEKTLAEGFLRITCLANYDRWIALPEDIYKEEKARWFEEMVRSARRFLPPLADAEIEKHQVGTDMFTPRTITKYTGHLGGAVYGAPEKIRDGKTPYRNLVLAGTDQGFLGITGSMLSGISMANLHGLQSG
ncbi:MAG: FAD-dependent oxidoreductase [Opitutales bacterium]|nr:FAD-dependent oxidoreductase [Opitutales bacterium]